MGNEGSDGRDVIRSEGIGVLVGAVARGAFVEVANAPPLVLRALEISGVDQVVAVTPAS
jgi:hypothetical protein